MSRLSLIERLRRMNQRSLFHPVAHEIANDEDAPGTGLARAEAVQRLQVGLFGIGAMVLLVGLASIIGGQADRNDQLAVPEAAPSVEPGAPPAQNNPLADAGVVPDMPAEPSGSPAVKTPDLPSAPQGAPGNAAPAQ
jgi:hypothetical protein